MGKECVTFHCVIDLFSFFLCGGIDTHLVTGVVLDFAPILD